MRSGPVCGKGIKLIVFLWVALLLVPACGKKGDPRAPGLAEPNPLMVLRLKVGTRGIVPNWSRPTHFVYGKRLQDLAGFVIFRK